MSMTRRSFAAALAAGAVAPRFLRAGSPQPEGVVPQATVPAGRFEPWIEVDSSALRSNLRVLARLAAGRPITAVVKNNAYGLGLVEVGRVLDGAREVTGIGVVKTSEALALREAGIRKPILLLAVADDPECQELVRRGVTLSLCTPDAPARVARAIAATGLPVQGHCYVDTGMSRMGVPYHRALPWMVELAAVPRLTIAGTLSELTEDPEFDLEQVRRLTSLAEEARAAGVRTGPLHAASSHGLFNSHGTHLDAVRPGIAIYGAYPTDDGRERSIAQLTVAFRLKARVVRVERMRAGDTVSYGRRFRADAPIWVATIPIGHSDGYPRRAVEGGRVLINGRTYPIVGAVSASHCVANLGEEAAARIGDVVTLLGPDDPAIHPNALAGTVGVSVYDVLMHISPLLPRFVA